MRRTNLTLQSPTCALEPLEGSVPVTGNLCNYLVPNIPVGSTRSTEFRLYLTGQSRVIDSVFVCLDNTSLSSFSEGDSSSDSEVLEAE